MVGVQQAFGLVPDLVTGPAAQTSAAVALVKKLTGLDALNIIDPTTKGAFREFLVRKLGLDDDGALKKIAR